jgi:hypothetical protein
MKENILRWFESQDAPRAGDLVMMEEGSVDGDEPVQLESQEGEGEVVPGVEAKTLVEADLAPEPRRILQDDDKDSKDKNQEDSEVEVCLKKCGEAECVSSSSGAA